MKYKKRFALASMLVIIVFGNEWLCNTCFAAWENSNEPASSLNYQYGIVLGGFANYQSPTNQQINFNESTDRLLAAIQLYKQNRIKKIVLTGGEARVIEKYNQTESEITAGYLCSIGIPREDIIIENQSKNTHENAINTFKLLLPKLKPNERVVLITSAYHCSRSKACFEHEGFKVDLFPTDYYTIDQNHWTNIFTIKLSALNNWRVLSHEFLGYSMYKILGYF